MSGIDGVQSNDAAGEDESVSLGARIRAARTARSMSVRELSRRVTVSASFISQVELGRATPSIGVLYAIASELGLSLDSLMESETTEVAKAPVVDLSASRSRAESPRMDPLSSLPNLQPADSRASINVGSVTWERLTAHDINDIEFLRIIYPSGSESCRPDDLQRHNGWEFGHILSGSLEVQVGFSTGTMRAGDSINFSSTIPHRLSNSGDQECVAIWVVVGRTHTALLSGD